MNTESSGFSGGQQVTSQNVADVIAQAHKILHTGETSSDVLNNIRKAPHKRISPQMPSHILAKKDLEGQKALVLRGLTNPKTGDLDPNKIALLPPSVQKGIEAAMETASTIGNSIKNAGYSTPGAMAHRNQVFLNMALENPDVADFTTRRVLAQPTLSAGTRKVAEQELALITERRPNTAIPDQQPVIAQASYTPDL